MTGAEVSAVERFLLMPTPFDSYRRWRECGRAEFADKVNAYEDAKTAALKELVDGRK